MVCAKRKLAGGLLLVAVVLAIPALLGPGYCRARVADYQKYKVNGFGLYQAHNGRACFMQLRDAANKIVGEEFIGLNSPNAQITHLSEASAVQKSWAMDCRHRFEQLCEKRRLDVPEYLGQALSFNDMIYYGAPPIGDFTRVVHYEERTCLLFTLGATRRALPKLLWQLQLLSLNSESVQFLYPPGGSPVVALELSCGPDGRLLYELRTFKSLKEAKEALLGRYSYTNFDLISKRTPVFQPGS